MLTKIVSFVTLIIIPLVMVAFSFIAKRAIGKNYKKSLGLITRISRQNQKTWNFSNRCACKIFLLVGMGLLILSASTALVCIIFNLGIYVSEDIIDFAIPIQAVSAIIVIAYIENRTYKKYMSMFNILKEENSESENNNNTGK